MKILFISMEKPYPDYSGGSKYAWQKIRQLSKNNDIFLVSFDETNEFIQKDEYEKYIKEYYFFKRKKTFTKILINFFKPYSLISRKNSEMQNKINELIIDKKIDLIILDSIHMYYNLKNNNNSVPIFLTQQNIEYKLFKSIGKSSDNIIKKMIYLFESFKLKKIELKLYKKNVFDGYIFISNDDLNDYCNEIGPVNAVCIPPSVDIDISQKNNKKFDKNIIVFSGKMNYEPNVIAAKWFVNYVYPIIKKNFDDIKFYVVGKNPTDEIKNLSSDDIFVTGMVPDVKEYLNIAKVVVIPLQSGGGVKLKLFEAIESNNIVITTSIGIEGTCFVDKKDLFVEDDPKLFAKRCIENLNTPNKKVAKNAQKTLVNNYSFNKLQERLQLFIVNSMTGGSND